MSEARTEAEEERRQALLDAACGAIAELGFGGVRVADIAHAAGTSTGTVHYYFDTKDEILLAAFTHAAQKALARYRHAISDIADPWDRLTRLVETVLPSDAPVHADWLVWLAFWAEAMHTPQFAPAHAEQYGQWRGLLADVIADGQAGGAFTAGDPDDIAAQLAALIDGLAIQALLDPQTMATERARRICLRAMELALGR